MSSPRVPSLVLSLGLFCLIGLPGAPAFAQSVRPFHAPETAAPPSPPPPLRLAARMSAAPAVTLRSATEGAADQLAALALWNRTRHVPRRVGFSRPLPSASQ